jgi:hypothetical protein
LIFTSPESIPDNTFKEDIKPISDREDVKQIWIIPLIEGSEDNYIVLKEGYGKYYDSKYNDWKNKIDKIQSKVRLYNEK